MLNYNARMTSLSFILSLNILVFTVILLLKQHNSAIILLVAGIIMTALSYILGVCPSDGGASDSVLFRVLKDTSGIFSSRLASLGLMLMLICGYVEYMKKIGANDAFAYVMMQPLSILSRYPNSSVIVLVPIGVLLTLAIPTATGTAMLLVTTIYPVLTKVGVNRLNALSIIVACTCLSFGFNSYCTVTAASTIGMDLMQYFSLQLKVAVPFTLAMIVVLLVHFNRHDKKHGKPKNTQQPEIEWKKDSPAFYAVLPVLPMIFSILFANHFSTEENGLNCAVLLSFFVSGTVDWIEKRSFKKAVESMSALWKGMGDTFSSLVVLIIAADIFAKGLVNAGFIDTLIKGATSLNIGSTGMTAMLASLSFVTTAITGSGTASFDAIAGLVPALSAQLAVKPLEIMLPVQMTVNIGRALSPIAAVMILTSEIGDVSPFRLAKHNIVPFAILGATMLILSMIIIRF